MKVAIGCDHGGFELKTALMKVLNDQMLFQDKGSFDRVKSDYPDSAVGVAKAVASGEAEFGVLICRTGIGMAMAANRFQNVRAANCSTTDQATLARQHNGANVLCLGANVVSLEYAIESLATITSAPKVLIGQLSGQDQQIATACVDFFS